MLDEVFLPHWRVQFIYCLRNGAANKADGSANNHVGAHAKCCASAGVGGFPALVPVVVRGGSPRSI